MRTASTMILAFALTAVGAPLVPAAAQDIELPARKSGQWQITMAPEGGGPVPAMTMEACVDEASDKQMMLAGMSMSKEMCPQQEMKREGDTIVIDSTCQIGPMATTSHVVVSGDFQSAYTVDITSESTGPAPMAGKTSMKQEARWVGDECTGGLQPGEMLMPGGMKVNVNDMMKMMGGG